MNDDKSREGVTVRYLVDANHWISHVVAETDGTGVPLAYYTRGGGRLPKAAASSMILGGARCGRRPIGVTAMGPHQRHTAQEASRYGGEDGHAAQGSAVERGGDPRGPAAGRVRHPLDRLP